MEGGEIQQETSSRCVTMSPREEAELCFPQLPNISCRTAKTPSSSLSLLVYTLLSSVSLLTVTLNLLVIISLSHFK